MRKVTISLDEQLAERVEAYSYSAGHKNPTETYRILISDGLLQHTERPYASLVREQVRQELASFMSTIDRRLAYTAEDLAAEIQESMSGDLAYTAFCALAALEGVAEATGTDNVEEFVDEALRRARERREP